MNGFSDWFENNWIDMARLLVQLAIFAAVVRYGRKMLATLRASQEQVGALLKLSVSDMAVEQPATRPEPEPSKRYEPASVRLPEPEPEMEPEPEPEPVFAGGGFARESYAAEREQSLGGRLMGAQSSGFSTQGPNFSAPAARAESPSLTPWVSAPAVAPTMEPERLRAETAPVAARGGVSTWMQAPMRSNGVNPWRKMVRWLQAPVRR